MIGSECAARRQRIVDLACEEAGTDSTLRRATEARQSAEMAAAKNETELAELPGLLEQAKAAAAAREAVRLEAERLAAQATEEANAANLISTQLSLATSALGCDNFADAARRAALNLRASLQSDVSEVVRATRALDAVANGDPESSGDLCDEAREAAGRLREAAQRATDAGQALKAAAGDANSAQRPVDHLTGRQSYLKRNAPELAIALEEARRAEAAAQVAHDAAAGELAALKQEQADAEAADVSAAAEDDANYTVIRVEARCTSPPVEDVNWEDEALNREAAAAFAPAHEYLIGLGAVCSHEFALGDSPAATYFLVVDGTWDVPTGADGELQFGKIEKDQIGAGLRFEVECAGSIVCASAAYGEIVSSRPDEVTDLHPSDGESRALWLGRVAQAPDRVEEALANLARSEQSIELCSMLFRIEDAQETEWLVEGCIPFGAVTLFAGPSEVGKSSMMQELATAVSARSGPKLWLGHSVNGTHPAALLNGEDPGGMFSHRQQCHSHVWGDTLIYPFSGSGQATIDETLRQLEPLKGRGLLVVDPVASFLEGDEAKSHIVSAFLNPLVDFARRKNWAVVVVHHVRKVSIRSLREILHLFRGSAVFEQRARMFYGAYCRGDRIIFGLLKANIHGHAFKKFEEVPFRRDEATHRLLPVSVDAAAHRPDAEIVLNAITRCNCEKVEVHSSGFRGLHERNLPELAGMSRVRIRKALIELLDSGRVVKTDTGLVAAGGAPNE